MKKTNQNLFLSFLPLIILVLLFLAGLLLRIYKLSSIPAGPEWDEASVGYNAFSIAKTLKDEWGNSFPLIFPAFGDFKNPLYIYVTSFIVKLFDLNTFTLRFCAALAGSMSIIVWYFIAFFTFHSIFVALFTALFMSIAQYGIFYSRIAGDGIMLSSFLISLGLLFEIVSIKKRNGKYFLLSTIAFILSIFSYNLARIVSPLLLISFTLVNYVSLKDKRRDLILPIILCFCTFFLLFFQYKQGAFSRIKDVGVFGDTKGVVLEIGEYRYHDKNNILSKILHNKPVFYSITLLNNYLSHFGTDFLVNVKIRQVVNESFFPILYLFQLPFYIVGIIYFIYLLFSKKSVFLLTLFLLFVIAPIPSMITEGAPNGRRYLASYGLTECFIALGVYRAYITLISKKVRIFYLTIFVIILLLSFGVFLYSFFIQYPTDYSYIYAARENKICSELKSKYSKYHRIVFSRRISGVPYIFPLFCLKISPQRFIDTKKFRVIDGWYYVDRFDKFYFFDEINIQIFDQILSKKGNILLFVDDTEFNSIKKILAIKKTVSQKELEKISKPLLSTKVGNLYMIRLSL